MGMTVGVGRADDFDLVDTMAELLLVVLVIVVGIPLPRPVPLPPLAEEAALVAGRANNAASEAAGLRRLGVVLTPPRVPLDRTLSSLAVLGRGVITPEARSG